MAQVHGHEDSDAVRLLKEAGARLVRYSGKAHPIYELNGYSMAVDIKGRPGSVADKNIYSQARKFLQKALANRESPDKTADVVMEMSESEDPVEKIRNRTLTRLALDDVGQEVIQQAAITEIGAALTREERKRMAAEARAQKQLDEAANGLQKQLGKGGLQSEAGPPEARGPGGAEGRRWSCEDCGKTFDRFAAYRGHRAMHRVPTMRRCPHCQYTSRRIDYFERHLLGHAPSAASPPPGRAKEVSKALVSTGEPSRPTVREVAVEPLTLGGPNPGEVRAAIEMARDCLLVIEKGVAQWERLVTTLRGFTG